MHPVILALCSNISFATASVVYTEYSRKLSSVWMNSYKALIAFVGFSAVCVFAGKFEAIPAQSWLLFILSGLSGLMIGDIFLLKAFTHLGSGRVLMIFGFQPLILGLASYMLFGQEFQFEKLLAILALMACLFTFSFESFKSKGHWDSVGLICALTGVALDSAGILMTRQAFDAAGDVSPFFANWIRSGATVLGFVFLAYLPKANFSPLKVFRGLNRREKLLVTGASFLGTFMSLSFYLAAVQKGHLASISAVAGTSPLFATVVETALGKKKFTWYLFFGTFFFILGFSMLL